MRVLSITAEDAATIYEIRSRVEGLAAAACNMVGGWLGAGLALRAGAKITRPIILLVLALLALKVLGII